MYRVFRNVTAESLAKGELISVVTFRSMKARMVGFDHVRVRAEPVGLEKLPGRLRDRRRCGLGLG